MCTAAPGWEAGAVEMTLRFAIDASSVLGDAVVRTQFVIQFQNDIATALAIPSQRIIVMSLTQGSLLVTFVIVAGTPSAEQLAQQVEARVAGGNASLFSLSFLSSFGISAGSISVAAAVGNADGFDTDTGQGSSSDSSFPIVRSRTVKRHLP